MGYSNQVPARIQAAEKEFRKKFDFENGFPAHPLGKRFHRLITATGWPRKEWKEHFGKSDIEILQMLGTPNPCTSMSKVKADAEFVLRLRNLEELYKEDLENLEWLEQAVYKLGRAYHHSRKLPFKKNPDKTYGWRAGDSIRPLSFIGRAEVAKIAAIEREFESRRDFARLRRVQGTGPRDLKERFAEEGFHGVEPGRPPVGGGRPGDFDR